MMELDYSQISHICRGLALLLHAGISLADGLFLLAEEETGEMGNLLHSLGTAMDNGKQLAEAMEESGAFPVHAVGMVRIGEETGKAEEALISLADFYEERYRTSRQIKNALAYPCMLLLLMLTVIAVLLIKVLPVFDEVYESLGSRLTGISAALLTLGQVLEKALPVLLLILLLLAGAALLFSFCSAFRDWITGLWSRQFGDRGVFRKFNNARFARALAMGLSSGLPLEEALLLSQKLLADIPGAAARCADCAEALEKGTELSRAMGDAGLLSQGQSRMLTVGIRGGNSDRIMEEIAQQLMKEANEALETTVSRIEPTMVLITSALVGMILLSVMLPLMNIMSAIG